MQEERKANTNAKALLEQIQSAGMKDSLKKNCHYGEKLSILNYPNPNELLNKRSEVISKGRHVNKFLLSNYKFND